jgi:hypothetical protein
MATADVKKALREAFSGSKETDFKRLSKSIRKDGTAVRKFEYVPDHRVIYTFEYTNGNIDVITDEYGSVFTKESVNPFKPKSVILEI